LYAKKKGSALHLKLEKAVFFQAICMIGIISRKCGLANTVLPEKFKKEGIAFF
jgi:hypothetical protein